MLWVRWKRKRVTWHQLCITWKEPDKRSPADRWGLLHQSREFPQFTQNFHRISEIKKRNPYKSRSCAFCLVPTMRLELIRPRVTTPSRYRVYQFHHVGINFKLSFYCCGEEPLFCSEDCPAGCCWVCAGWLCSTVLKSKPWLFALVWI